ncbi:putative protein in bacteria (plasmid) [Phaeobacter inhibens]|uniref:Tripartite tricarboxylate transporter substrate binding protein n=1 Tax=Phaeobacter inhibens TaxID=221822 RepID=A0ABM6RKK3_9RHOB|nr:tripartite tricarboxylate transporter substrate-binding protein [Phaeobacter inhibens]AUQ52483.1 putative protein in bacteria [Phaeobacter inhibens]AUQ97088.1 putative protein in bacteria [Phaeobacter inhibens]AUR22288.1 putative protein in bacteria [Phaeobacter inhibens]
MKIMRTIMGLAIGTVLSVSSAMADDWKPDGTLRLQIAFGAGGSTDTMGRVLAQTIKENTGWNIIAENKTGGGGVAMFTGIAKMPPRGLVIGLGVNEPILVNLATRGDQLAFDLDDFDYLGTVAKGQIAAVAAANAPFSDLASLSQHAKANGSVAVAIETEGQKALMEAVAAKDGVTFKYVTSSGAAESLKMILGGQVQVAFGSGEELRYLESGDMKVLAGAGQGRLSHSPDAKTFAESGYDIFIEPVWYIATTAGTEQAARDAIAAAIDEALKDPRVIEIVKNTTKIDPVNFGPEGTKQMMVDGLINANAMAGN